MDERDRDLDGAGVWTADEMASKDISLEEFYEALDAAVRDAASDEPRSVEAASENVKVTGPAWAFGGASNEEAHGIAWTPWAS